VETRNTRSGRNTAGRQHDAQFKRLTFGLTKRLCERTGKARQENLRCRLKTWFSSQALREIRDPLCCSTLRAVGPSFGRWFAPRRTRPDCRTTGHSRRGQLRDPRSLEAALDGVTRAYLVTPSSPDAEAQQVRFAELAAAAGVGRLVKLSQFAADEASPVRFLRYHAAVERRIRELGIGFTFLRPNLYFQGLLAFQPMIAAEGHFVAPIGDARVSAVDVRDIATVASIALTEEGHDGTTYTITGPRAVTHTEMASALAKAIGRPVAFIDVPSDAFASALKGAGVPAWQVRRPCRGLRALRAR
jgi:uncharacterized protein YbjT (DUF2867 family)